MKRNNEVYALKRELMHLEDDPSDAWINDCASSDFDDCAGDDFEGWENLRLAFKLTKPVKLPERITMHALFDALELTDFPVCEPNWPVMSKKMIETLKNVGNFSHTTYPLTMINSDVNPPKGSSIENKNYLILHLLEHLDIIDIENSEYQMCTLNTEDIDSISKLVLKKPQNGFPPIFRLKKFKQELFISNEARLALEKTNILGLEFTPLDEYWAM